ncbi:VPS9 domain protein [Colletotrichum higginsianum]|nr:VPS9 domain protein [Colletotrichum higginsianum]
MTNAMSAQEMLDLLLSTIKLVTHLTNSSQAQTASSFEKPTLTVNADTLVSLLLFVVIRAQVRHLHARLIYIRHFIFIDDVDNGEMGYALSTFEAVLAYLVLDSAGLRKASRRNKALWDAACNGSLDDLKRIMEPDSNAIIDDDLYDSPESSRRPSRSWSYTNGSASRRSSTALTFSDRFSSGSGLSHVFPFQAEADGGELEFPLPPVPRKVKRVAMDTRSMSSGSEISYHSRATSNGTVGSALEGDISIDRLSQTHNSFGESILMMAVQNERPHLLRYLLSLNEYYSPSVVLDDINNEDTTLFSAAVQLGHTELINIILEFVMASASRERLVEYLAQQDIWGRSCAHYLFHAPFLISRIGKLVPWRQRDKNGQTPLFALCRSYDHVHYREMVDAGLDAATEAQGDGLSLHVDDHVDAKGNTLLHIVNDPQLALRILQQCDVNVNATNEKKFTPLMVASKYGRLDMVRTLFMDASVDVAARELRSLTAVELAKDDDIRNKIDDLALFSMPPAADGRITGVVRAFFVEDATIRLVLKSAAPADHMSYTVTTSRRNLSDFEHLGNLLALENPASWIPAVAGVRSPFQIPSKPSRAVLRDIQTRADWFLKIMLNHPTFATHEMLWEFFLVPDIQLGMMEQRSNLKAETRAEKVREEYEPVKDVREVEQFSNPYAFFHSTFLASQSTIQALLSALSRPPAQIAQISVARKSVERNYNSLTRSTRWPLGLLDDTRQRFNEEREVKARQSQEQVDDLGRELRYSQQVVAGELAGWQDLHEKMGRRAIKEFAKGMMIQERLRLAGMMRALRRLREGKAELERASASLSGVSGRSSVSQSTHEGTTGAWMGGTDAGEGASSGARSGAGDG